MSDFHAILLFLIVFFALAWLLGPDKPGEHCTWVGKFGYCDPIKSKVAATP